MKKIAIILLLLTAYGTGYCQYADVSFYVVAHPDQWQLFMGSNAYNDITQNEKGKQNKVVFIYTTAGQENCNGPVNSSEYLARQQSAQNCIEFCADRSGNHAQWQFTHVLIQGHNIVKYTYKNVESYYLHLPGGCGGQGMQGQSLAFLQNGAISSISALDSTATYHGWNDLAATIRQIITNESAGITGIALNTAETDTLINNGDDPDRMYSAALCMDAANSLQHFSLNLFTESTIATLPANLDDIAIANKAALLSQLDYVRTESGLPSAWTLVNVSYLSRNYYRTITK